MPRPVLGVIGSDKPPGVRDAEAVGALAAREGWVVLTGGRNTGTMAAALKGARSAGGLTVGVLPNSDSAPSPDADIMIVTDMNNARNNVVGLSSNVLVACGVDGPGTASEVALALKNGKPVILLNASAEAVAFFRSIHDRINHGELHEATSPEDAVEKARRYQRHESART